MQNQDRPAGIERVLVANRGVVAVRVIRSCRRLGIETVLAVSEADRDSAGARLADAVVCIGPPAAASSYLRREAVLAAAKGMRADAIHPGYGFLAEDATFASMCDDAGVRFIGPSAKHLALWGDKVRARRAAERSDVPVARGSAAFASAAEVARAAQDLTFPLLVKAVAGGGGKGVRLVEDRAQLEATFPVASAEARSSFGDASLYLEEWVPFARHVEVQIVADSTHDAAHLGDRDCSVQRRHQKVIEEAPAAGLPAELQEKIRSAAVRLCLDTGYDSIGTVEFLVDKARDRFVFLEVNPRLQVEHGVTELICGLDLVELQLRIAAGEPGAAVARATPLRGAAIECRVNAEDPWQGFRGSPGKISGWTVPEHLGARVDTHCFEGYTVGPFYDSLLANLLCAGSERAHAIASMREVLASTEIAGIATTLPMLKEATRSPEFARGTVWTTWLESRLAEFMAAAASGRREGRCLVGLPDQ